MNKIFQPFSYLQALLLIIGMEDALVKVTGNTIADCLLGACRNRRMPATTILKETKEMITDNEGAMQSILGGDLVQRIKSFQV